MTHHIAKPIMFSALDIASMLQISRSMVYKLVQAGDLPEPVKIGSLSKWEISELTAAISKLTKGAVKSLATGPDESAKSLISHSRPKAKVRDARPRR